MGSFASEVTRVAREVSTEGILGGQAQVKGVAGTAAEALEQMRESRFDCMILDPALPDMDGCALGKDRR
jgi:CheY-like chemotaxis protein